MSHSKISLSLLLLSALTVQLPAHAMTIDELKQCESEDIALLEKQTEIEGLFKMTIFSGSAIRASVKQQKADLNSPFYQKVLAIVENSKSCSEINNDTTLGSILKDQISEIRSHEEKHFQEKNKNIISALKYMGLHKAAETITSNEVLLNLELQVLGLLDLGQTLGNKGPSFKEDIASFYEGFDILREIQQDAYSAYELGLKELESLPEFRNGIPSDEARLIELNRHFDQIQEDTWNQMELQMQKLTAQELEKTMIEKAKFLTQQNWRQVNSEK